MFYSKVNIKELIIEKDSNSTSNCCLKELIEKCENLKSENQKECPIKNCKCPKCNANLMRKVKFSDANNLNLTDQNVFYLFQEEKSLDLPILVNANELFEINAIEFDFLNANKDSTFKIYFTNDSKNDGNNTQNGENSEENKEDLNRKYKVIKIVLENER